MPGVRERMNLGRREAPPPFVQEIAVENEILLAPADQHRHVAEAVQPLLHLAHQFVAGSPGRSGMSCTKRSTATRFRQES